MPPKKPTKKTSKRSSTGSRLRSRVPPFTDAEIRQQIRDNPDAAPLLTRAWFRRAEIRMPAKGPSYRTAMALMEHVGFRLPMLRSPTKVGVILEEELLKPLGISQKAFARRVGLPAAKLDRILWAGEELTPEVAVRFARVLGTSAELWLNLERSRRMWLAVWGKEAPAIAKLKPMTARERRSLLAKARRAEKHLVDAGKARIKPLIVTSENFGRLLVKSLREHAAIAEGRLRPAAIRTYGARNHP